MLWIFWSHQMVLWCLKGSEQSWEGPLAHSVTEGGFNLMINLLGAQTSDLPLFKPLPSFPTSLMPSAIPNAVCCSRRVMDESLVMSIASCGLKGAVIWWPGLHRGSYMFIRMLLDRFSALLPKAIFHSHSSREVFSGFFLHALLLSRLLLLPVNIRYLVHCEYQQLGLFLPRGISGWNIKPSKAKRDWSCPLDDGHSVHLLTLTKCLLFTHSNNR